MLGLATTIVGGAVVVALVGTILHHHGPNVSQLNAVVTGTAQTAQGTVPHAFLNLATYPDSLAGEHGTSGGAHPDWVSYGPSTNLHVPAHAFVTVTIKQYDGGETITNPYFAKVRGTVGGTMTVNGKTEPETNPNAVGHTFTIHAAPTNNEDPPFVSVPLPAVPDDRPVAVGSDYPPPNVVTFSFVPTARASACGTASTPVETATTRSSAARCRQAAICQERSPSHERKFSTRVEGGQRGADRALTTTGASPTKGLPTNRRSV